ncbi:MAG TPA: tripartite tricarboxylate transporter substrate binding protein [Bradyrhizobium sp.]|nr:tripartite tricarboxylate transporter substrate binding protein [Bradyrhizobium sp.]
MKLIIAALSVMMAGLLAGPATAAPWPDHAVRLIVPYPPGGNVDTAARVIANKLQEQLKQPFVIENKAGAGGLIAGEMFAKSTPDGYTLFVGANGPVLFAPEIERRDAYNWRRDFIPITCISMTPLVLEVHPSVPAKSLKEFLDLVRREPGKLTMASPGAGTTNHLLSELIQSTLDVKWLTVHYRGNAPATNDLIAGHVQFAFDQVSVALPFVKKGMIRALAITSSHRTSWLPDVPTFAELGYKDIDAQTFTGLFAPKGTPPDVVNRIHDVMLTVLHDPEVIEKFNVIGAETVPMKPAEFTDYLQHETDKWIPIVRKADIKTD